MGSAIEPIPQVPKKYFGLLGNLPDIEPTFQLKSFWNLSELYGPIFELDFLSRKVIAIANVELAQQVLDDQHFEKVISGALFELRPFVGDGLFTAFSDEE
ncbi:hypothetical protein LTR66_017827, partial [Elasticomyces elasticus]